MIEEYTIYSKLNKITSKIIKELNECVREYNKTYNKGKLIEYIIRDNPWSDDAYGPFLDYWSEQNNINTTEYYSLIDKMLEEKVGLVYCLPLLADIVKGLTGCSWMTFMVQDPKASEMLSEAEFIPYNFGIKSELQPLWIKDIKDLVTNDGTVLTRILFRKNIIEDYIFCFRVGEFSTNDDNIFYIDYLESGSNVNIDFRSRYSEKKERIASKLRYELRDHKKVKEYVEVMRRYFNASDGKFCIYIIPALNVLLYPSSPTRSGIFMLSEKEIDFDKLSHTQHIISHVLCHLDYLRSAMIQRTSDFHLVTHDIKESIGYVSLEIQNQNVKEDIKRHIAFIDCVIKGFQKEINKISIEEIYKELNNSDWLKKLSDFARSGEPKWSRVIPQPNTTIEGILTEFNFLYSINSPDSRTINMAGIILTLLLVILKNAWKHEYNYYSSTLTSHGIEVTIIRETQKGRWCLIIKNKANRNNKDIILEKRALGQGTFAVVQFLINLINDGIVSSDEKIEFEDEPHYNSAKEDFIQKLYLPTGVLKCL